MKSTLCVMSCLAATLLLGAAAPAQAAAKEAPFGSPVPGRELDAEAPVLCNIMYQHAGYGGSQLSTQSNWEWWSLGWFNDQMSSLVTYSGCYCTIYWDANFLGSYLPYDRRYSGDLAISYIGSQWNDQVSSIICYGP